ncbi:DNA polymerase III subunit delta [Legionella israelensis]|nr:DNA polymerase III subunit delta [Legionella israelensis]
MLIKHQALIPSLKKAIFPLYVLVGPEYYFVEEETKMIKEAFSLNKEVDYKILTIQSKEDWYLLNDETNSYSLFASHAFLDVRYEKKNIDQAGKEILLNYLADANQHCLLLIRCPCVPVSQLQWLSSKDKAVIISAYPPSIQDMRRWIISQLQQHQLKFTPKVIDIILYKVQGNMLACSQAIQKMILTYPPRSELNADEILEQLSDQSEYQFYDLTASCLAGETEKAIRVLRKLMIFQKDYSLILWIITEEIRVLLQLKHLVHQQQYSLTDACKKLKIWKQRIKLYQTANHRLSPSFLQQLILTAHKIDLLIKTGKTGPVSHLLESMVLSFSQGQK